MTFPLPALIGTAGSGASRVPCTAQGSAPGCWGTHRGHVVTLLDTHLPGQPHLPPHCTESTPSPPSSWLGCSGSHIPGTGCQGVLGVSGSSAVLTLSLLSTV